jgi:uncharacterized protein YdeI (YjbR/CyaY-like superfamily)
MNAEMAANGLLRSGAHVRRVAELIEREYEIRAILIWQILSRVISGQPSPIAAAEVQQIKEIVEAQLDANSHDIKSMYEAVSSTTPRPGVMPPREGYRTRALEKVRSEIDISLLVARRSTVASSGSTTVNIYQPYGIVQTGAGSNAQLICTDSSEVKELLRALDAIERDVAITSELDPQNKSQILEIIVDTRNEISKSAPNIHRVRGTLMAIATTVQTLGSASSAYQLFKGAAALFGVNLP